MSQSMLDELLLVFRDIRSRAEGVSFNHILLNYVGDREHITPADMPPLWRENLFSKTFNPVENKDSLFQSVIAAYSMESIILPTDPADACEFWNAHKRLCSELVGIAESAGRELLQQPVRNNLPIEITAQKLPAVRWFLYLHYVIKPEMTDWEFGGVLKSMGIDDRPAKNATRPSSSGEFTFEPHSKNSYSMVNNVAQVSIDAIIKLREDAARRKAKREAFEAHKKNWGKSGRRSRILYQATRDSSADESNGINWIKADPEKLGIGDGSHSKQAGENHKAAGQKQIVVSAEDEQEVPEQKTFKPADLKNITKLSDESVRQYLISSGIPRAGRGQSNYEYPESDVITFINHVLSQSISSLSRKKCEAFLQSRRSQT